MTYIPNTYGIVSDYNSTSGPLGAGSSFTGSDLGIDNVAKYASISVGISVAPTGATGTLYLEFSDNGTAWDTTQGGKSIAIPITTRNIASNDTSYNVSPELEYFRVRYVNGPVPQTLLKIQTIYNTSSKICLQTSRFTQQMLDNTDLVNTRACLAGKNNSGIWDPIRVDDSNNIGCFIANPITAFGELRTSPLTPIEQITFVYNLNPGLVATGASGTSSSVIHSGNKVVLSTGANTNSYAELTCKRYAKYRPGQGILFRGTAIFSTGATGSSQVFGFGDDNNGFFFGYNGTSFGINRRDSGVDNWIPQTSWNIDRCDGLDGSTNRSNFLLNPQLGNVYQIQMQWHGFGAVFFSIEDPITGLFLRVHKIDYANTSTSTSIAQPSQPGFLKVKNTTNNTNITMSSASLALFLEGIVSGNGLLFSISNSKASVTTEVNILTIRSDTTFQSISNKVPVRMLNLNAFSVKNSGSGPVTIRMRRNVTLGGSPSYTQINANQSVVSYDTAGTTVSGGTTLGTWLMDSSGSLQNIGLDNYNIELIAGETMTITAASSANIDVYVSLIWRENTTG